MVTLTINNQKIEVEEGINLLTAIERAGIKIPTLCYHKALYAFGSCRLCVVEVQIPGKESTVQASCSYPVIDGIKVFTHTERIFRARKIASELLLARCPDSETIKNIAEEYGVKEPRIRKKYERPFKRWDRARIESEVKLKQKYGLKNKRERSLNSRVNSLGFGFTAIFLNHHFCPT